MNAMSHAVPNSVPVEQEKLAQQIAALVPGYMNMGHEMSGQMNMPLPANTLPMMTGAGRYGDIEMGGMFTMVKIRADLAHGDYRDPGWYQAPAGSVAYEWKGEPPPAMRGGMEHQGQA
jgi:manganese oxidase